MPEREKSPRRLAPIWRVLVETGFIVFLFYSNLLMGQFDRPNGQNKTLFLALKNVFTFTNLTIGIASGLVGFTVVEFLRKRI